MKEETTAKDKGKEMKKNELDKKEHTARFELRGVDVDGVSASFIAGLEVVDSFHAISQIVYVCACVCECVCVRACVSVRAFVGACARARLCVRECTGICACVHVLGVSDVVRESDYATLTQISSDILF